MMRDNLMRWLTLMTAVGLLVLAAKLPQPRRLEPLRVAVGIWPGAETLVLARDQGLLPEERFKLMEVTWAAAIGRAFNSGVVDAAVLSLDSVLRLLEQGVALRVIYVMDESKGADAVLVRDSATRVSDLKGARVAVDVQGSGTHLLSAALESAGMKRADLEIVPMPPAEMNQALQKGEVRAVVAAEPWIKGILAAGAVVLSDSTAVQPPIYRVLVVTDSALAKRKQDLVDLLRGHLAMLPKLLAGGAEQPMDSILRREGLSRENFAAALSRVRSLDVVENQAMLRANGQGIAAVAAVLQRQLGGGERPEQATGWADDSILQAVAPGGL